MIPDDDHAASDKKPKPQTFRGGPFDGKEVSSDHQKSDVVLIEVSRDREAIYCRTATGKYRFVAIQSKAEQSADEWTAAIDREMKRLGIDGDGGAE